MDKNYFKSIIDYLKGENPLGMSYIVGFSNTYPQQPHHRGSSCPASGTCDWNTFNSADPNPMILYGALVGGPSSTDTHNDARPDHESNEVTTDYNAGFQGVLAFLIQNP